MSTTIPKTEQTARLAERIRQHKVEVARLREQYGDPKQALDEFMRARFEYRDLVPEGRPTSAAWEMDWEEDDDFDAR